MDWKTKIQLQLKEASNHKAISKELLQLSRDLLEGDTEFQLVFLSGRGKYISVRFLSEIKIGTKKIIFNKYNLSLFKILKP